jgi:hypothetical protein
MNVEVKPKLRPIRLDLDPEVYRMLRVVSGDLDMSMARYARELLSREIRRDMKERGLRLSS